MILLPLWFVFILSLGVSFLISHLSISIHGQWFPQTEPALSVNASCLFLMLPPSHIASRKGWQIHVHPCLLPVFRITKTTPPTYTHFFTYLNVSDLSEFTVIELSPGSEIAFTLICDLPHGKNPSPVKSFEKLECRCCKTI